MAAVPCESNMSAMVSKKPETFVRRGEKYIKRVMLFGVWVTCSLRCADLEDV